MCISTLVVTFNTEKTLNFLINRCIVMKLELKRFEETAPFFN